MAAVSRLFWALMLCALAAPLQAQRPVWVVLRGEAADARALEQITRTGAEVRYASRWLPYVSVNADNTAIAKLRALETVQGIRPVGQVYAQSSSGSQAVKSSSLHVFTSSSGQVSKSADFDSAYYGINYKAIKQLGIPAAHRLGFTGSGIRIAIIDTGFELQHESLITRTVDGQRDFINDDVIVSNQPSDPTHPDFDQEIHGTHVWSILGGFKPNTLVGPAFDASFLLAKVDVVQIGDGDLAADEDRWVAAVEWAETQGARLISSSLTYRDFVDRLDYQIEMLNGDMTISALIADEAARRGVLIVNAIGDLGPGLQTLSTPADADSVLAVGAVDSLGNPANFAGGRSTARGPTFDGRLKPDLVALGKGLLGARSAELTGYDANLEGTSYSTPLVAGAVAMFMEAWPALSVMAARNALILSGSRAENPDNDVGFGVPNVASAILFPEGLNAIGITGLNATNNQLTTIQPTFTWSAPLINTAMRPVRYRLEVATDAAFTNVVYSDTISEAFSLRVRRPLRPAPTLFWRVVAEAAQDVRRTTRPTPPFSVPDWVRLLTFNTPTGAFTDSVRPVFHWEALDAPAPSGPLTFEVQILNAQTGTRVQTVSSTGMSAQPRDPLAPNVAYRWRVIATSTLGVADTVESLGVFVVTNETAPPATLLYQNFPNPFPRRDLGLTSTRVWFDVNTRSVVHLAVYDLRGRLVRTMIPSFGHCGDVTLDPGQYGRAPAEINPCVATTWDGTDASGKAVSRGVYILRLRASGIDQVKRILYLPD